LPLPSTPADNPTIVDVPPIRYARSGDVNIAFQVIGGGPTDLVVIRGSLSNLASVWDQPLFVRYIEELATFSRAIMFDKRGMGLSDRPRDVPTLEARMDDIRAVMDAAGSEEAALWAAHEGARIACLFAATYPERTRGLILYDPSARGRRSADYPWGRTDAEWRSWLREIGDGWGTAEFHERVLREYSPSVADDEAFRRWYIGHMLASASPGAAVAFQRMVMEGDVTDVLPAIRVPTLVLHRAESLGQSQYVASRIRGAILREVPGLVDGYTWADPEASTFMYREMASFLIGLSTIAQPERVLVTVLFTDIVGSTERAAALGDDAWRRLLAQHNALVRRRLAEHRGEEINTTGDGFVAAFDGPGRAIEAACSIRDSLRSIGLEVRAGIHTGEGERHDGQITGIAVHLAARVAALAGAGEILVSRTVHDLVAGSGLEFDDRGEHPLKGLPGEWRLFAVMAQGD
jgi:class 3 adenylate cyclase